MGAEKPKSFFEVPQFIVGCSQSVGKGREHNEDALFTLSTTLACDGAYLPFGLFIVADGMGGQKHGEKASNLAVRCTASQIIQKILMSILALQPTAPNESIQEILETSIKEAHQTIMKKAPESGSTLTAILLFDKLMSIAHVGDSRAYIVSPEGAMQVLTHDHSLVMRMIELGQLTVEEALVHPQRNVLYRAMGYGEQFAADISTFPLPQTGYVLLCSDGLWGIVPQEEISSLIINSPDIQIACQRLVDAANAAGGPDNISAILVRIPEHPM
jgi:serine/threonine protein phosphatase PrpC